ncbi:MAG TPA: type I restriction enzyme HsdR N-terminal domain-containing protein [Desulfomicrobiaceae bacterium]|nr:type I restriction enzyme HsdR N-terminal domain-containing protein [Desulfomicrobiaceae bacterium]
MHEVSLNRVIRDYLTGQEIEETTYEDLRQGLARMLVQEKGYPPELIKPRLRFSFSVQGQSSEAVIDLAVFDPQGRPLLAFFFCPGDVGSFLRQSLAAARIAPRGVFPVVTVSDSMVALVALTHDGSCVGESLQAVPGWERLKEMVEAAPQFAPGEERLEKERRILYAYSGLGGACCGESCTG